MKRLINLTILAVFVFNMIAPWAAQASVLPYMSEPGTMITAGEQYSLPQLVGMRFSSDNPYKFTFILSGGNVERNEKILRNELAKIHKYFLAALTIPETELWVNLSPYEQNRITPDILAKTTLGQDLLGEDYVLKQLAASLTHPDTATGKEYWTDNKNDLSKIWIVPEKIKVLEAADRAIIDTATLTVKSDGVSNNALLPAIKKEVNEGRQFAQLRQIYSALIMASWFKNKLKDTILNEQYFGKGKLANTENADPAIREKIYNEYLKAFNAGVYNLVKAERAFNKITKRNYFCGGVNVGTVGNEVMAGLTPATVTQIENQATAIPGGAIEGETILQPAQHAMAANAEEGEQTLSFRVALTPDEEDAYQRLRPIVTMSREEVYELLVPAVQDGEPLWRQPGNKVYLRALSGLAWRLSDPDSQGEKVFNKDRPKRLERRLQSIKTAELGAKVAEVLNISIICGRINKEFGNYPHWMVRVFQDLYFSFYDHNEKSFALFMSAMRAVYGNIPDNSITAGSTKTAIAKIAVDFLSAVQRDTAGLSPNSDDYQSVVRETIGGGLGDAINQSLPLGHPNAGCGHKLLLDALRFFQEARGIIAAAAIPNGAIEADTTAQPQVTNSTEQTICRTRTQEALERNVTEKEYERVWQEHLWNKQRGAVLDGEADADGHFTRAQSSLSRMQIMEGIERLTCGRELTAEERKPYLNDEGKIIDENGYVRMLNSIYENESTDHMVYFSYAEAKEIYKHGAAGNSQGLRPGAVTQQDILRDLLSDVAIKGDGAELKLLRWMMPQEKIEDLINRAKAEILSGTVEQDMEKILKRRTMRAYIQNIGTTTAGRSLSDEEISIIGRSVLQVWSNSSNSVGRGEDVAKEGHHNGRGDFLSWPEYRAQILDECWNALPVNSLSGSELGKIFDLAYSKQLKYVVQYDPGKKPGESLEQALEASGLSEKAVGEAATLFYTAQNLKFQDELTSARMAVIRRAHDFGEGHIGDIDPITQEYHKGTYSHRDVMVKALIAWLDINPGPEATDRQILQQAITAWDMAYRCYNHEYLSRLENSTSFGYNPSPKLLIEFPAENKFYARMKNMQEMTSQFSAPHQWKQLWQAFREMSRQETTNKKGRKYLFAEKGFLASDIVKGVYAGLFGNKPVDAQEGNTLADRRDAQDRQDWKVNREAAAQARANDSIRQPKAGIITIFGKPAEQLPYSPQEIQAGERWFSFRHAERRDVRQTLLERALLQGDNLPLGVGGNSALTMRRGDRFLGQKTSRADQDSVILQFAITRAKILFLQRKPAALETKEAIMQEAFDYAICKGRLEQALERVPETEETELVWAIHKEYEDQGQLIAPPNKDGFFSKEKSTYPREVLNEMHAKLAARFGDEMAWRIIGMGAAGNSNEYERQNMHAQFMTMEQAREAAKEIRQYYLDNFTLEQRKTERGLFVDAEMQHTFPMTLQMIAMGDTDVQMKLEDEYHSVIMIRKGQSLQIGISARSKPRGKYSPVGTFTISLANGQLNGGVEMAEVQNQQVAVTGNGIKFNVNKTLDNAGEIAGLELQTIALRF